MSYGIAISSFHDAPVNVHWGARITCPEDLPQSTEISYIPNINPGYMNRQFYGRMEFPSCCSEYIYEPCLKLRGKPDLEDIPLSFSSYDILTENHFVLKLVGRGDQIKVHLHYVLEEELDLILRHAEIINCSAQPIRLENAFSAQWCMPRARNYVLTHLPGGWGQEYLVEREPLTRLEKVLESRTGISGHQQAPFFAIAEDHAREQSGDVYYGTLLWSGNWKFIIEKDEFQDVTVCGGLNNYDFEQEVDPGESFITPEFIGGFTDGGYGEASRRLHRYQEKHIFPENLRGTVMPALFNTYSTFGNKVTEENVLSLIPKAAEVGIELFVIDAGWQKYYGDWIPNQERFPHGFTKVGELAHSLGMKFGVWVEVERVNRGSDTAEKHPEWLIDEAEYSLLNLALPEAAEHIYNAIADLLRNYPIDFIKTDFNRYLGIPHFSDRRSWRTQYVKNYCALFERLRTEFPDVVFENCASGSGRLDISMNRYFARINRSDNQDTLAILGIQEGFTYLHPAKMAGGGCQISKRYAKYFNGREFPLQFQAHMAMMGWLSLGLPLDKLSEDELKECANYIGQYKKLRHIAHLGDLYRLASYRETRLYAAFEFVLPDRSEALLFVFAHGLCYEEPLPEFCLHGLAEECWYAITQYGRPRITPQQEPKIHDHTGRFLMNHGMRVTMNGDLDSRVFHFRCLERKEGRATNFRLVNDNLTARIKLQFRCAALSADMELSVYVNGCECGKVTLLQSDGEKMVVTEMMIPVEPGTTLDLELKSLNNETFRADAPVIVPCVDPIPAEAFLCMEIPNSELWGPWEMLKQSSILSEDCETDGWEKVTANSSGLLGFGKGFRNLQARVWSPDKRVVPFCAVADYWWSLGVNGKVISERNGGPKDIGHAEKIDIQLDKGWNYLTFIHGAGNDGSTFCAYIGNPGDLKFK